MNRRTNRRRALAIGLLFLVMSACGGTDTADTVADPTTTDDRPVVGTELAGVEFDVRRDPG